MKCKRCGTENREQAKFCSQCQLRLKHPNAPLAIDDLISDSQVVSRHLLDPEIYAPPASATHDPHEWRVGEALIPVLKAPVKSRVIPKVAEPEATGELRSGFFNYRRPDSGELVLAKPASYLRRIWAAVYDQLFIFTIVGLPGAILVLLLANSQTPATPASLNRNTFFGLANGLAQPVVIGFSLAFTLVSFLYFVMMTTLGGETQGEREAKIRVVNEQGQSPGLKQALIRTLHGLALNLIFCAVAIFQNLEILALSLPFLLGLGLAFFTPLRQTLADKLARTYVINNKEMVEDYDF